MLINTSQQAEVSLSPSIIIPLLTGEKEKKFFRVRTLLDSGSGTNWIVMSLLKHIEYTVKGSERLEVITFSGTVYKKFLLVEVLYPTPGGRAANLICYAHDSFTKHVAVKGMTEYVRSEAKIESDLLSRLADPATMETDHNDLSQGTGLILCSASINKIRSSENIINLKDINILLEPTIFGVAISGAIPPKLRDPKSTILAQNATPSLVNHHQDPRQFQARAEVTLPEDISFMWEQETLGIRPEEVHEDHRLAWDSFMKTITRDENSGQYTVGLPWNEKKYLLRDNKAVAAARTYGQRHIMASDKEYGRLMKQAKEDLLTKDYIETVDTSKPTNNVVYYMPYRGIIKRESTTTKCRLVMDASSKVSASHVSLNQALYQGPNLIVELAYVLLRFMLGVFGSVSDIEKAFLRILIAEVDRDALRFFWIENPENPNEPLTTYRFKAVMFGSSASPFQLAAVLQTLIKNDCENVRVKKVLESNIYVDNVMHATDSEEHALEFFDTATAVFAKGSFVLRQWASNSPKLMDKARALKCADEDKVVKVLGLFWDIDRDRFLFSTNFEWDRKFTKRSALSYTNKVFDPLGWLAPLRNMRAKFIQKLWENNLKWEDSFEFIADYKDQWLKIVQETHLAVTATKTRVVSFSQTSEIHIFSDASKDAYGAVIYVRTPPKKLGDAHQVHLVAAKSRITPKKTPTTKENPNTIPKFELAGVVVAAHQLNYLKEAWSLPQNTKVNLWCDARVVLSWLTQYEIKQTYIHNRVAQIRELCHPSRESVTIRYVPTDKNPADILTKDQKAAEFINNKTWWDGPDWLCQETDWPEKENYQLYPNGWGTTRVLSTLSIRAGDSSFLSGFNTHLFKSGLRVMAYVLRAFRHNSKRTEVRQDTRNSTKKTSKEALKELIQRVPGITKEELDNSKLVCIRIMQREMFTEELNKLQKGETIKEDPLGKLGLYLDPQGIIKTHGRSEKAIDPATSNNQILVNGYHPFVQSYIQFKHKHLNCSSKTYTLHMVRRELTGPYLTVNVNKIVNKCLACRVLRARPYCYPKMPPLPSERLAAQNPFAVCGIDYCGPYYVKQGRSQHKVWIALFTCFVSRGIHLELVTDLSADSFLGALKTMSWIKCPPKVIMTDNATNFTKASKILKEISKSNKVREELNLKGINWIWTPAYSPHFGGIYERMVSTLKKEMVKLIGLAQVTYHELRNHLAEIEGIVNSRPLIKTGNMEVITPKHIITGRHHNHEEMLNVMNSNDIIIQAEAIRSTLPKLYQELEERQARFWKNFQLQYLESLKYTKDTKGKANSGHIPKAGDLVIIHSKDPRLQWRKAIVLEVYPGIDNQIRKCRVRTATGETIRAARDLYPLEIEVEEYVDDRAKDENIRLRGPDHKIRAENKERYPDFEGFEDPNPPNRALMALELLSKREEQANAKLVPFKKRT